jgi:recombination protein RecT
MSATATATKLSVTDANLQTVRALLGKSEQHLAAALPAGIPVSYMIRVVLTAVQRTPRLLECHPLTLLGAVFQAAQLGLVPDGVLGQAYLVPFKNTKKGRLEVQFQPGYRGLMTLARRSGDVSTIDAEVVRACDTFHYERGTEPKLSHVPYDGDEDPGALIKVWALARLRDGGIQLKVMTGREVAKIKARSAAVQGGHSSPWDTDPEWMWRKTCLKQLCKLLPVSVETQRAIDLDDRAEVELPQDLALLVDENETATEVEDAAAKPAIAMPQRKAEEPPPAAATSSSTLTIARVESARGSSGAYYVVHLSDGRRLSTKDAGAANAADVLTMKHTPVRLLTRAAADTDPGIEGTAVLVITPPPDTDPQRTPRLDQVR